MTISYSENNKRETIFEPLLNRQRLVYKGPVPSSILNLANDQLYMDINRLNKKLENLQALIDQSSDISRNDLNLATPDYYLNEDLLMTIYSQYVSYDETTQEYVVESSTPYYEDSLEFNKPQLNSAIISNLSRKLDIIEAKLRGEN
jgi:hypothetical protein